jgi:hypothetical protein
MPPWASLRLIKGQAESCRVGYPQAMKYKGIAYHVAKVPAGWQWAVSPSADVQFGSWEPTREEGIRMAKQEIEIFLSKRKAHH